MRFLISKQNMKERERRENTWKKWTGEGGKEDALYDYWSVFLCNF